MMQAERTQRKYALTRIKAGDYLLPSNDRQTVFRLMRYEDGPSHGIDPADMPRDRMFWGVWKWTGRVSTDDHIDLADWDRWNQIVTFCESREAAISAALGGDQ